ncbi:MAG: NUDIX domain-containing protein [Patescibacteria group bacterium]
MNKYFPLQPNFKLKIGAVVEIVCKNKTYILVSRSFNGPPSQQSLRRLGYELVRGTIEYGQSLEKNIVREIKEETGLNCRVVGPLALNYYAAPKLKYSDCQIYFICRPLQRVNANKVWLHKDTDQVKQGKRWFECRFIAVKDLSKIKFGSGQRGLVRIYQKQLLNN